MSSCHGRVVVIIVLQSRGTIFAVADCSRSHLSLEFGGTLHLAAVLERTLAGAGTLCEGSGTTEGACGRVVVDTYDADVICAPKATLAGHALGHLNSDGGLSHLKKALESDSRIDVGSMKYRDTAKAEEAIDIIRNLGILKRGCISATRGRVDCSNEGTSTIGVDLLAMSALAWMRRTAHERENSQNRMS